MATEDPVALQPGETVALAPSALRTYHRNPRKGDVKAVAASLAAHGQFRPIVANIGSYTKRKLEVLAGNHTLKAFRELATAHPDDPRWSKILVHLVDVDEDQATRIVLADNRTAQLGGFDNAALADLLDDVRDDLTGLGYTATDLDDLLPAPEVDVDLTADPPAESPGRGNPVYSYAIVFDDVEQKKVWLDFTNWLRRTYPDLTAAERLGNWLEEQAGKQLAETEES